MTKIRYPRDYDEVTRLQLPPLTEKIAYELVGARNTLLKRVRQVREVAAHVEQLLTARDAPSINSLGEMQQTGSQFDAACAEYALAAKLYEIALASAASTAIANAEQAK